MLRQLGLPLEEIARAVERPDVVRELLERLDDEIWRLGLLVRQARGLLAHSVGGTVAARTLHSDRRGDAAVNLEGFLRPAPHLRSNRASAGMDNVRTSGSRRDRGRGALRD
ncbi:hypothetical protein [Actinokineospora sp. UTMC 2448]|uniref:hypothetical protein n=1 Tax=Actinokineospora sp. UTMC 2448 TaxID=2268449 RepID=UPI00216428CA|nr:hypothetical protein [Actinokineospora sp. UTMC 2448]